MNRLPSSWAVITLAEVGSWRGGGTPSKDVAEFWVNGDVPWVSPKDMKSERIRDSEDHITDRAVEQSATSRVPEGSVLVVTRSGILARTLPVAVTDVEVTVNQDLKALIPSESVEANFVAWALRAFGLDILEKCKKDGTTVASIEFEALRCYQVPLAPQKEQRRIVEAIDSYLTRLDDAVASLERVKAKLKAYRASVLKAAVEGRLVPTEASLARAAKRAYEPAEALLARILKERRRRWEEAEAAKLKAKGRMPKDDKWKGKYQEPAPPDVTTLPQLPPGWCWASASALCTAIADVDHKMPAATQSGIPYVSTRDFRGFNEIDFIGAKRISNEMFEQLCRKIQPQFGDILLSRYGTVGEVRLIEGRQRFQASYSIAILKPVDAFVFEYFAYALRSAGLQAQMRKWTRASAQPDLGLAHIRQLAIPLPPVAEQERMKIEVDRLLSISSQLDAAIAAEELRTRRLRLAVLKWAFEGKLVDQDPTDEPAERLLARIRAECSAVASMKKSRGRKAMGAT